jgi:hypothetical protein
MFCPNCGAKLQDLNQKYCQNCGSEIGSISEPSKPLNESYQYPSGPSPVYSSQVEPDYSKYQAVVKPSYPSGPGPLSKKALGFSIVSIIIAVVTLSIGSFGSFLGTLIPYYILGGNRLILGIGVSVAHIIGLSFGSAAKSNAKRASISEVENPLQKIGNVFGIFGILLNAIPLCLAILFSVFSFIFNLMPGYI